MKTSKTIFFILFISIFISSCVPGGGGYNDGPSNLKVASEFRNDMEFQSGVDILVYGTAFKTTDIKVVFNGVEIETKADAEGNWKLNIPKQKVGGPYEFRVIVNDTTVVFKGVRVAENIENMQ